MFNRVSGKAMVNREIANILSSCRSHFSLIILQEKCHSWDFLMQMQWLSLFCLLVLSKLNLWTSIGQKTGAVRRVLPAVWILQCVRHHYSFQNESFWAEVSQISPRLLKMFFKMSFFLSFSELAHLDLQTTSNIGCPMTYLAELYSEQYLHLKHCQLPTHLWSPYFQQVCQGYSVGKNSLLTNGAAKTE